jgi:hypothetical protein
MNINTLKPPAVNEYCMLSQELLSALGELAERKTLREYAHYYAASAFFGKEKYDEVERVILSHLEARDRCELISCSISSGTIYDSGAVQFHILKGRLFEFYDYTEMSACFIRLYHIRDLSNNKEWVAMYIDENPATPWWAEERL